MSIPSEDDIRDQVAKFILDCVDSDCLYEMTQNFEGSENWTEETDRWVMDRLYHYFDCAKVSVVIDELEYNGN